MGFKIILDEIKVIDMYLNKKMSSNMIAKEFRCSPPTITKVLKKNNVKFFKHGFFILNRPSSKKIIFDEKEIRRLYLTENKNASEIGRMFNCTHITILNTLKRFNIPRKSMSEARRGKYKGKDNHRYGKKNSRKTRKKISEFNKGKPSPMKGKNHTEKTRKQMSESCTGRKHSNKTRKQMSKSSNRLSPPQKNKKFDEIYGEEKSIDIRTRMSKSKIKYFENNPEAIENLKEIRAKLVLPVKDTTIEIKIQNFLKQLGITFFTHQYMKIEHGYQCDILIPVQGVISKKIIIECDGDYFHMNPNKFSPDDKIHKNGITAKQKWELDESRTKELIEKGFKVLRLWECEIKEMDISEFKNRLKP